VGPRAKISMAAAAKRGESSFFFFKEPRPRLPGRTYPLGY